MAKTSKGSKLKIHTKSKQEKLSTMQKHVKICFTFIMSGHAHVLISPGHKVGFWPHSECQDFLLDPGHYFIFFNGASAGGTTMTVSVDGTLVSTQHFPSGTFSPQQIVITI